MRTFKRLVLADLVISAGILLNAVRHMHKVAHS